ncbi:hypothetical protein E2C01_025669 [Portunus trituberculatus]|uniref:Uncharacterized protein n=1 Tax=Portunus trituberculatus TaxID=210409 RepID=A0A5B7EGJ7_PORTR|nr:hypothetical protein [Portunus trituberculatus]
MGPLGGGQPRSLVPVSTPPASVFYSVFIAQRVSHGRCKTRPPRPPLAVRDMREVFVALIFIGLVVGGKEG